MLPLTKPLSKALIQMTTSFASEELNEKIQHEEQELLKKLVRAGVDDLDFLKDANDSMVAPDTPPPVVMATQAPRRQLSLPEEPVFIPDDVILQTQIPPSDRASERRESAEGKTISCRLRRPLSRETTAYLRLRGRLDRRYVSSQVEITPPSRSWMDCCSMMSGFVLGYGQLGFQAVSERRPAHGRLRRLQR